MDRLAEFQRLKLLFYGSFWVSGLAFIVWVTCVFLFWRQMRRFPDVSKILRQYPLRVRVRIAFLRERTWLPLVNATHVDQLRAHHRNSRRLLAASVLFLTAYVGLKVLRQHWLARATAIGEAAAAEAGRRER